MLWLLFACNSSVVMHPEGEAPPMPSEPAWKAVRPLDGVQRLFGGPFRCRIPDGTVVDFHPNGMARGEPAFRGNWKHGGTELVVEARHEGVELTYEWSYTPFNHQGDWVLGTRDGALACRPGHEGEPGGAGDWVDVLDAGGATDQAARVLSTAPGVVFAVDGAVTEPIDGLVLRFPEGADGRALGQHLATGLQRDVRLEAHPDLGAPFQLVVGR